MSWFTHLFSQNTKSRITEADTLFSFLAGITHNPDAIESYLYKLQKVKRKQKKDGDAVFIELYLDWQKFILNNKTENKTTYTQEMLHEAIRKEIDITKLDLPFKLLFLEKREHIISLYGYFTSEVVVYIAKSIGSDKLATTLKNLQSNTILSKITFSGNMFHFELIDKMILPNNIDYPLNEVTDAFKTLMASLYNIIEVSLGQEVTRTVFNALFTDLKKKYDAEIVSVILKIVPQKVLDFDDWVSLMSKQELETQVREKTKELEELTASLETQVEKRTKELQDAYEDLKVLDQKKSEFISVAAHQLRTPLSGLKWSMKMLHDGELGPVTDEQKHFLAQGLQTNDKVLSLITDLLDIDLLAQDKIHYSIEPTDLIPIIETIIHDLEPQAKRKGIRVIKPDVPENVTMIAEVDGTKMSVVLQNLIDNAIKYCEQGDTITIDVHKINTVITFSIKDTGIGIPQDAQTDLFQRFFRADNAVRKVTEGSGIGLYITKNIIEDHGGRIWFESTEHEGTTFFFELPMYQDAQNQGVKTTT